MKSVQSFQVLEHEPHFWKGALEVGDSAVLAIEAYYYKCNPEQPQRRWQACRYSIAGLILVGENRLGTSVLPPSLYVALYRPEIHPNTGNIARICAANQIPLYLVGSLGFRIDDRAVRRAGLDYWPYVEIHRVEDLERLHAALPDARFFYFSARAKRPYTDVRYRAGDCLVFGPESRGLPENILSSFEENALTIPMRSSHVRSLNLATAAAVAVYEALRQIG